MPVLIAGGTGLLGQSLASCLRSLGRPVLTLARRNADFCIDLTDEGSLRKTVEAVNPGLIINAAAITDLGACESNPGLARKLNADAPLALARIADARGCGFIHISTDHFHTGGKDRRFAETDPVDLVNEYARSKYAGECFALELPESLVIRVNMTGKRGWPQPTFAEWAWSAFMARAPLKLFSDAFASVLDAPSCAKAIIDLHSAGGRGLINVGSHDCVSKKDFLLSFAKAAAITLDWAEDGSVASLSPVRAESLGMDVSLAEDILGYRLPSSEEAAYTLAKQFGK